MSRPDHLDLALADLERYVAQERAIKEHQQQRDFYLQQQQPSSYSPMYITSPHTNRVFAEAAGGSLNRRVITSPNGTQTLAGNYHYNPSSPSAAASPFSPPPMPHSGFDAPVNTPMIHQQQRYSSTSPSRRINTNNNAPYYSSTQQSTSSPVSSTRRILTDAEIFAQARREAELKQMQQQGYSPSYLSSSQRDRKRRSQRRAASITRVPARWNSSWIDMVGFISWK